MGDPVSVAANIAGLLSLGIHVTQSLVNYYTAYQNQDSHIARTTSKLENLLHSFQSLGDALDRRSFHTDEHALITQIESSIEDCNELIIELKQEFEKFSKASKSGIKDGIKTASRRLAYPFRQSTLQKLEEDVSEIRENLSHALNILHLNDDMRIQDDLYELKAKLDLLRIGQLSQELREWLNAPDATTNHYEACAKKHANSGMWFVKGVVFTKWLQDDASFLWLHGFSGSGKSVLCSTAIQYTFRHRVSNPRIGIAFFYFSFNDNSKQNTSGLLRAILSQLSSQLNDSHADFARLYSNYGNGEAPVPALLDCVRQIVLKFQDVYLYVDALDESPRYDTREHMLKTITDIRAWSLNSLHILVTSRDEQDIREHLDLSSNEEVSLNNADINKDIEDYIRAYLEQDRDLQKWSSYHPRIQKILTEKAGGVFRWVECQFRSLKSCPRSEDRLERLLTSLPQSLDETYERMLLNIDSTYFEDARRILMWLCFCKRPLTVRELIDGIAIELGSDAQLNRKCRLQNENDILQICPGLISIVLNTESGLNDQTDKSSSVVCIAHSSVQDYLESDRICQQKGAFFSMRSPRLNVQIAQMCLVYLLDPVLSKAEATHSTLDELPLAKYAAEYWYIHVKKSDTFLSDVHFYILQLYFDRGYAFQNSINIYDYDEPFHQPFTERRQKVASKIYYAALLGLDVVIDELLNTRNKQFSQVEEHTKPLSNNDLDINAQGGRFGNALQAASAEGHEKVVQLLLNNGANANAQGGQYGNALQAASVRGHERVVRLLLDKGADIGAQGGQFGNALQAASAQGQEKVVQLLLDQGADVSVHGGKYGNALMAASIRGHEKVIRLLQDEVANINAQGGQYGNPLQAASVEGGERGLQLLEDEGTDISAQSGEYYNALQVASSETENRVSYTFQMFTCTGRRRALLIGINYFGQRGQLKGCINDVKNMSIYLNQHFSFARENMVILTDDQQNLMSQPLKANILRAMHWLVKDARPGDSLFFHYSGHGGQTPDLDGDEDDGYDEVIYPVDFRTQGHIVDDEMHRVMVKSLSPGVRLTAIFDSCHSGSALDLPYIYSTQGVLKEPNLAKEAGQGLLSPILSYARGDTSGMVSAAMSLLKKAAAGNDVYGRKLQTKIIPADVVMWSGSKDEQMGQDANIAGQATGAMSWAFITALKKNPHQSYAQLTNSIHEELMSKFTQKPQMSCSRPLNTDLLYVM